ncbi:hypothetical protein GGI43DRAFT_386345 [Trichoderma evansii]
MPCSAISGASQPMPWPLQCTHERAELSVDLFSVGIGSTDDVLQDGRRSPESKSQISAQKTAKLRPKPRNNRWRNPMAWRQQCSRVVLAGADSELAAAEHCSEVLALVGSDHALVPSGPRPSAAWLGECTVRAPAGPWPTN